MMEIFNSYENRHGDYIKCLVSSPIGRDGINVNSVAQIHLIGSEWTESANLQALSRAIRATSHNYLLEEERIRLIQNGEAPENAYIPIEVYKHAAISADSDSIDYRIYHMAEYKDRAIRRTLRMMKQCAVTCAIHYPRNVRSDDVDGSAVCDYDKCKYECVDIPNPAGLVPGVKGQPDNWSLQDMGLSPDFSTYDVLYSSAEVYDCIEKIRVVFRDRASIGINELKRIGGLAVHRGKFIDIALEKIITEKIPIPNRFGYNCYLYENNSIVYLQKDYPVYGMSSSPSLSVYSSSLISFDIEPLQSIVSKLETSDQDEILQQLRSIDPTKNIKEFDRLLSMLNIDHQAILLEDTLLKLVSGESAETPFSKEVLERFKYMYFTFNEPVTELNNMIIKSNAKATGRGRPPNPENKTKVKTVKKGDEFSFDNTTPVMYAHIIYSQSTSRTGYNSTSRFNKAEGRIRILQYPNSWRDVNDTYEFPVYNKLIQILISNDKSEFEKMGVYGFILDGQFKIRDVLSEKPKAQVDDRNKNRGKVCETWTRDRLVDVLWNIGYEPTNRVVISEGTKEALINTLLRQGYKKNIANTYSWDENRLKYYIGWMSDPAKRDELCRNIYDRMEKTGRIENIGITGGIKSKK